MRYEAFISYSRKDARVARRLHRALERYRVPRGVKGGDAKRHLGRFCKDDDEFRASEHLGSAINGAIDDSKNLIVIASPDAALSKWVNAEVIRFKQRGAARVFAFIVRGSPDSKDPQKQCFPSALRFQVDSDGSLTTDPADPPLAPSLAEEGFARAFIRLVAGLIGEHFDTLWRRERRRVFRRRITLLTSVALAFIAAILILARVETANDVATLRDRSITVSTEQWQRFGEGSEFDPAFRAALAATILDHPGAEERWDLSSPSDSTSRALALSGRILPFRRVFGDYPDTSKRGNFRNDIADEDPARRMAIQANVSARYVCFSGDSKRLGLSVSRGRVLVYDIASGSVKYSNDFKDLSDDFRIALDESGTKLLVGGQGQVKFIDVEAGSVKTCPTPEFARFHEIRKLANRWLLAAARGRETLVFEFDPAACQITNSVAIPEFTPYNSSAFSEASVLFVGYDSWQGLTPVLHDFSCGKSVKFKTLGFGVGQVKAIAIDSTGDILALGGNGSGGGKRAGAQLFSLGKHSEFSRLVGHTGEIYTVDFMPQTKIVVTGGTDMSVRFWEADTGKELLRLAGHVGNINDARFSPDSKLLATCSSDGTVLLWDVNALRQLKERSLLRDLCNRPQGAWQLPPTIVTPQERQTTAAFQGRPWDVLEWRDPSSPVGAIQSVRALIVRWFGWSLFDYAPAEESLETKPHL